MSVPNPRPPLSSDGSGYTPDYGEGNLYGTRAVPDVSGAGSGSGSGPDSAGIYQVPYEPSQSTDTGTLPTVPYMSGTGSGSGSAGGSAGGTGGDSSSAGQSIASGLIGSAISGAASSGIGPPASGNAAGSGSGNAADSSSGLSAGTMADLADAYSGLSAAQQSIANQIGSSCNDCYDRVTAAQTYIYKKIVNAVSNASQCACNCQTSLANQLAQATGAALETAAGLTSPYQQPPQTQPASLTINVSGSAAAASQQEPSTPYPGGYQPPINLNVSQTQTQSQYQAGGSGHKQKELYVGWCPKSGGPVIALPIGTNPPSGDYVQTGIGDTEQQAIADSVDKCPQPPGIGPKIGPLSTIQQFLSTHSTCKLGDLVDYSKLQALYETNEVESQYAAIHSVLINIMDGFEASFKNIPLAGAIGKAITGLVRNPYEVVTDIVPLLTKLVGCDDPLFGEIFKSLTLLNYFSNAYGVDIGQFALPYNYLLNSRCRERHLDENGAFAAYLSDAVTPDEFDILTAISGLCPDDAKWKLFAQKSKAIPPELAHLRLRGIISPTDYQHSMRRLGYLEAETSENLFKLYSQLPPVTDLIRFMVRDADDPNIVNPLGMDDLFGDKFGPQIKKWSEQTGVPEDYMKYAWRSHWVIPAPGQLFEFWHRLRRKPQFGTPDEQRQDIQRALIHNDILPHWFDKYFAVNYNPIPIRYLRQSHAEGSLTDDETFQYITELGYSDETAKQLLDTFNKLKDAQAVRQPPIKLWSEFLIDAQECLSRMNKLGYKDDVVSQAMDDVSAVFERCDYAAAFLRGEMSQFDFSGKLTDHGVDTGIVAGIVERLGWKVRSVQPLDDFEDGILSRDETIQSLTQYGMADGRIYTLVNRIDGKVRTQSRKLCINSTKRQFLNGAVNVQGASNQLIGYGITLERSTILTQGWQCELSARDKAIPASKLCEWLGTGAINGGQFVQRLMNIGYSRDDATQMMSDCLTKINEKQAADAAKRAKQQMAEEAARQRAIAKGEAAILREENQLIRARKASAEAKLRREKQLLGAASAMQKVCSCDYATATQAIRDAKAVARNEYGLSEDEALQVLMVSAAKWKGKEPADYLALVAAESALLIESQEPSDDESAAVVGSTNGSV